MKLLTHQQLREQQLKLLEIQGFSLAEYADPNNKANMFKELPSTISVQELGRLKIRRIKSAGVSINANLKALSCALLHTIYWGQLKEDVLDTIKSSFYRPEIDLTMIKHNSLPHLSSNQMKKIMVQFFYSLAYSNFQDKVEVKLCKFPIVMEILVLFFRTVLSNLGLKSAQDYLRKVPTCQAYNMLINYFDLTCKTKDSMFLFYQDKIFIVENRLAEVMVGCYMQNDMQQISQNDQNQKLKICDGRQQNAITTEKIEQFKLILTNNHQRNIQIRGVVSDSVELDNLIQTPCFGQKDCFSSFRNSRKTPVRGDIQKIKSECKEAMKNQIERPFVKIIGKSTTHQFSKKNYLKYKPFFKYNKTISHNQTTQGSTTKKNVILTANNSKRQSDQFKIIKKSKSQYGQKINHQTKERPNYIPTCICVPNKQQKIKLASNLYHISIKVQYRQSNQYEKKQCGSIQSYPSLNQFMESASQAYASQKAIGHQNFVKVALDQKLKNISQIVYEKHTHNKNHPLTHAFSSINPQHNKQKRSTSPYSLDNCNRSFSNCEQIINKPIVSPRVNFSYKNTMKYSTDFNCKASEMKHHQ